MVIDPIESEPFFHVLDGLPLAIAQAGEFLQQTGTGIVTDLEFHEQ